MLCNSIGGIIVKKIMLWISILLFIVSGVILLFGIWGNNNTAKFVGFILLALVNLFNIVRRFNRLGEGK
jgi:hypothetical protein